MTYIDTSVLVAYLCPEPLHAPAVRAMAGATTRLISPLVRLEVASALAIKTRTREMDLSSARRVMGEMARQIDEGLFVLREISTADYQQALAWLERFSTPLRSADALHLACAAGQDAILLTADRLLASAARTLGVRHKLIR